jgi:small basic protein (TIGR04137 family)
MSLDSSLKIGSQLGRHRNVLTRAERVAKMIEKGTFKAQGDNPVGLPKLGNRKVVAGKGVKKEDDAAAAAGAKGAPAAKGAAGKAPAAAAAAAKAPAAKAAPKK